jgi:hypothetical protein
MKTWNPDDSRWAKRWNEVRKLDKHLPGKHDQKTHGVGGGGKYQASSQAMFLFNNENFREVADFSEEDTTASEAYEAKYSTDIDDDFAVGMAIENYVGNGYSAINGYLRGNTSVSNIETESVLKDRIAALDKGIEESPEVFGGTNLYRVFSNRLVDDLEPGDTFIDKGFLSTTRINLTKEENRGARLQLADIGSSEDTVGVILPNPGRNGKGLAIDFFLERKEVEAYGNEIWQQEREVLLPRETPLLFLGFTEGLRNPEIQPGQMPRERVAVFQRMD